MLQILLSTTANTSPVERGFTYLEMVASTRRLHFKPENLETLLLLSASKVRIPKEEGTFQGKEGERGGGGESYSPKF